MGETKRTKPLGGIGHPVFLMLHRTFYMKAPDFMGKSCYMVLIHKPAGMYQQVASTSSEEEDSCGGSFEVVLPECCVNGLVLWKLYRKQIDLMGKSMVSCRFSLENPLIL